MQINSYTKSYFFLCSSTDLLQSEKYYYKGTFEPETISYYCYYNFVVYVTILNTIFDIKIWQ